LFTQLQNKYIAVIQEKHASFKDISGLLLSVQHIGE